MNYSHNFKELQSSSIFQLGRPTEGGDSKAAAVDKDSHTMCDDTRAECEFAYGMKLDGAAYGSFDVWHK